MTALALAVTLDKFQERNEVIIANFKNLLDNEQEVLGHVCQN